MSQNELEYKPITNIINVDDINKILQENKQLKEEKRKAKEYCKTMFTYGIKNNREQAEELLEILGGKENE